MEVRLDEIVVDGVVAQLPRAHGVQLERLAGLQRQVIARIDVDEDVTGLVAAVVLDVVLDAVGAEGVVERHVKGEVRPVLGLLGHAEHAGAGQPALDGGAEVVSLVVVQPVPDLALAVGHGL